MSLFESDAQSLPSDNNPPTVVDTPASRGVRASIVAAADRACAAADGKALAIAVRQLLSVAPRTIAIDLVAVVELARHDLELAMIRWSHLRARVR